VGGERGRGGGSLTALPIVETKQGNISAYIPTNLISITDGQIMLDADLFNRGVKPAVDAGLSVSRVGGAAQTPAMRAVVGNLRLELAQFEEVARFARFGTDVGETTRQQIRRGERLQAALTQPAHRPLPLASQVVILQAATEGLLDDVALQKVPAFEAWLLARIEAEHPGLLQQINRTGELPEEMRQPLAKTIAEYHAAWFTQSTATTIKKEGEL
jgi:F-type H+-transporting ATPase subunit alpha